MTLMHRSMAVILGLRGERPQSLGKRGVSVYTVIEKNAPHHLPPLALH